MLATWIVLAGSARARIPARITIHELREVEALTHPESRMHQGDLRTGSEGSVTDRMGQGQRQPEPHVTTGEKRTDVFAGEIAAYLVKARNQGQSERLVIAAEPTLLGAAQAHGFRYRGHDRADH